MIYIGADHRGFELKEYLRNHLIRDGLELVDVGASTYESEDDYVDYASLVAKGVLEDSENRGIVLCGSGVGVDVVANKFDGIRCALVMDMARAKQSREHEDVNVISLASDVVDPEEALKIVKTFLETQFSGEERHKRRIAKIAEIEDSK